MSEVPHVSNWINGAHTSPTSKRIEVINPATEELIATVDATPQETVDEIISSSLRNFQDGKWSQADASERFAVISKAASLLRERLPEFIELETRQTGRPIREMKAQLGRVPEWLDYFAALARVHEGRAPPFKGPVVNVVTYHPLGVIAQITPWNHPMLIAMKKIGPALAAGNILIVKPSELAPLSVLKLGALFKEAGLPDGALQIVSGYGWETGKFLCESPRLAKIDITGGLGTYNAVAPLAAKHMIPLTAELGGKAPVCIFPSVDINEAVRAALFASFIASGQTCITGSRILVHTDIYDEFVKLLETRTKALRVGDPTDEKTQVGAVIRQPTVDRCAGYVSRAVESGGKVIYGGEPVKVNGKGFFFAPTLIETQEDSELACNEVFGPVVALIRCESEEHLIKVANGTSFGLGASVWSNDFAQAYRVASKIDAGIVWINAHHLNDPSSPWGGFKESGIGKENGIEAYESYTKVKSTVINYGIAPSWFDDEVQNARYG